jgi:hypothetical protein
MVATLVEGAQDENNNIIPDSMRIINEEPQQQEQPLLKSELSPIRDNGIEEAK